MTKYGLRVRNFCGAGKVFCRYLDIFFNSLSNIEKMNIAINIL